MQNTIDTDFVINLDSTITFYVLNNKGQVAWISEKQRLPVQTVESFTVGGFTTNSREIT